MSVKVIWKAKSKDDKLGYIRLSSRIAGKTVLKNLPLEPVERKHFNDNTQRLRSSFKDYEYYNGIIESKLDESKKKGNKIKFLNDDKKSFIDFMNKVIDDNVTGNIGTKQKYENLRNLVMDYNEYKFKVKDVKFSEITVEYLEGLRNYMMKVRKNQNNSIFYKFKGLKSFVTKAQREKIYTYEVNPFSLIKNKLVETTVDVLNKDDLKRLMNTPLTEVYRSGKKQGQPIPDLSVLNNKKYENYNSMNEIRNFFLFQLFCQGIRVSDLLTLRWQDFYIDNNQIRIKKRMVKVKTYIDVLVNYNTLKYINWYIKLENLPPDLLQLFYKHNAAFTGYVSPTINVENLKDSKFKQLKDAAVEINLDKKNFEYYNHNFTQSSYKEDVYYISMNDVEDKIERRKILLADAIKEKDAVKRKFKLEKLYDIDEHLKYLQNLLEIVTAKVAMHNSDIDSQADEIKAEYYLDFAKVIEYVSTNKATKQSFVFPLLNDEDFKDIVKDDFSTMNEHQYLKFTGTRSYYNRLLKIVAEQCKIYKPLTSHVSRHSFTSLMIEIGVNLNLFDLMKTLGHKHLNTTQVYISKFSNKRIDSLSLDMVNYMDKD